MPFKQVLIALWSFSKSIATKCVPLNNERCLIRPTIIDLNPVELNYYLFAISLAKCSQNVSPVDDLSTKIFFPSK